MTLVITLEDILLIICLIIIFGFILLCIIYSLINNFLYKKNILKDCAKCEYFHLDSVNSCGDCWHTCQMNHFKNTKSATAQIQYLRFCKDYKRKI